MTLPLANLMHTGNGRAFVVLCGVQSTPPYTTKCFPCRHRDPHHAKKNQDTSTGVECTPNLANPVVRMVRSSTRFVQICGCASGLSCRSRVLSLRPSATRFRCAPDQEEVARLREIVMDSGPDAHREVIVWVTTFVNEQLELGHVTAMEAWSLQNQILALRAKLASLYEYKDQPIPFVYIHMVYLLTSVYLPLFSYSMALSEPNTPCPEAVGGMLVLLNLIFVIGIRVLGSKLADPFGSDVEDLSTMHYVSSTNAASLHILHARLPRWERDREHDLHLARPKLGNGFRPAPEAVPTRAPASLPAPVFLGALEKAEGERRSLKLDIPVGHPNQLQQQDASGHPPKLVDRVVSDGPPHLLLMTENTPG